MSCLSCQKYSDEKVFMRKELISRDKAIEEKDREIQNLRQVIQEKTEIILRVGKKILELKYKDNPNWVPGEGFVDYSAEIIP